MISGNIAHYTASKHGLIGFMRVLAKELAAIPPETNYWGLALVAWGMVQMLLGSLGAEEANPGVMSVGADA